MKHKIIDFVFSFPFIIISIISVAVAVIIFCVVKVSQQSYEERVLSENIKYEISVSPDNRYFVNKFVNNNSSGFVIFPNQSEAKVYVNSEIKRLMERKQAILDRQNKDKLTLVETIEFPQTPIKIEKD
jgi:hypothetical protein